MPDIDFQRIVLNLIPKQGDDPVVFYASQYETARPFIAELMWGDTEFTPGDDYRAEIDIRKNDDNLVVITDDVAIDNNEVSVILPVQAVTCIGKNLGQVKIYAADDQLIAALNFILEVQPDPLAGGVTSETAIDNLTTQIDDIISGEGYVKDTDLDVLQSDWDEADPTSPAYIKNKPSSGTQVQADWTEADTTSPAYIQNKPSLATVATTGDYDDLIDKPDLKAVATSGSYNDLTDKPTIPAAQVQSDYAQTNSGAVDYIKNKPELPFESKGQYLLKTTPATKRSIEFTTLIGGTCGVNQLVNTGDTSVNTISGHKYLTRINHVESIIAGGSAVSINDSSEDNVIDLTAMFGTTIADYVYTLESGTSGAGITWLKNNGFDFSKYAPYNAGGLLSVKTSKKINVGFNQWDEQWENGYYALDGTFYADANYVACKNFISIIPSTIYYFKCLSGPYFGRICYYDKNKNFLNTSTIQTTDIEWQMPNNAYYFKFDMLGTYGNTYKNDICINISDANKNGTYEPYVSHEYPLDDIELRGILKLDVNNNLYYDGDTYESNGSVTRKYGIVDLGSLSWNLGSVTNPIFYAPLNNGVGDGGLLSSKFVQASATDVANNTSLDNVMAYGWLIANNCINIVCKSYNDATAFASAMSGVYLVYELATLTTETADAFTNPMIVDGNGTEEFVDGRTVEMPVGHDTFYIPMN